MTPDTDGGPRLRPARTRDPAEVDRLYEICLRTGAVGEDATDLFTDRRLLGDVFLGAYLRLEPELAWALAAPAALPVGYLVGTADTAAFEEALDREWWPGVRARLAATPVDPTSVDALVRDMVVTPLRTPAAIVAEFPAHLHVDLLPEAQGRGHGGRLMATYLDRLRQLGVRGVHLGVDPGNARAIAFYRHLGFRPLVDAPTSIFLGRDLEDGPGTGSS